MRFLFWLDDCFCMVRESSLLTWPTEIGTFFLDFSGLELILEADSKTVFWPSFISLTICLRFRLLSLLMLFYCIFERTSLPLTFVFILQKVWLKMFRPLSFSLDMTSWPGESVLCLMYEFSLPCDEFMLTRNCMQASRFGQSFSVT